MAATTVARFSPSGFYVASGDCSGQVRVWDAVEAVNTKGEYSIISGRIKDIAWDGDGTRVIAVGDGRERFGHCFTADSGNSVGEISGHSKAVNSVSIRQQRPLRAATVSDDGTMCFLHGAPFKFAAKSAGVHKGFVMATAFSPDGTFLVTVGADRGIQLYDGKTGEHSKQIGDELHSGTIFAVSWAPDSKRFVTASADQTVRIWDAAEGKCLRSWRVGEEGSVSAAHQQVGVVWVPGRKNDLIISLSLDGDLNYFEEGDDKPIKKVQGHNKSITALAVSTDGKSGTITTGSFDGRVCSWDVSSGTGTAIDGQAHTNQVAQFASTPGRVYSVGWDDTLRIIDGSAKTFAGSSSKLNSQPRGIASAGGYIFVAVASGVAVFAQDKLVAEVQLGYALTSIAAAGLIVAVGTDSNEVYVHKVGSDGSLSPVQTLKNSTAAISALSFSKDGKYLAAGNTSGKIAVYDAQSWELKTDRWSAHTARVLSLAWNDEGTHAVSGGLDTNAFIWSLSKPGSRVKATNAHKEGVYGVSWVNKGKVATTGGDAAVKLWAVEGLQ
jgi:WD40 repeat protein